MRLARVGITMSESLRNISGPAAKVSVAMSRTGANAGDSPGKSVTTASNGAPLSRGETVVLQAYLRSLPVTLLGRLIKFRDVDPTRPAIAIIGASLQMVK